VTWHFHEGPQADQLGDRATTVTNVVAFRPSSGTFPDATLLSRTPQAFGIAPLLAELRRSSLFLAGQLG
jgi:hypothetical protein